MTFEFYLTIWGAALSTILAFITVVKHLRENRSFLSIVAHVENPYEEISITICNISPTPATITSYKICFGEFELKKVVLAKPIKLSQSDIWINSVSRKGLLIHNYLELLQDMNSPFTISVTLSTGKIYRKHIYISPQILNDLYNDRIEPFVHTDGETKWYCVLAFLRCPLELLFCCYPLAEKH